MNKRGLQMVTRRFSIRNRSLVRVLPFHLWDRENAKQWTYLVLFLWSIVVYQIMHFPSSLGYSLMRIPSKRQLLYAQSLDVRYIAKRNFSSSFIDDDVIWLKASLKLCRFKRFSGVSTGKAETDTMGT